MRKKLIGLAFLSLLTFGTYSCSNDEVLLNTTNVKENNNKSAKESFSEVHPEVQRYYENIKTIIFSTKIYDKEIVNSLTEIEVPFIDKLRTIEIEDIDSGEKLDFWKLEDKEIQYNFLTEYLKDEARTVSDKLNNFDVIDTTTKDILVSQFNKDNQILESVMLQYNVNLESAVSDRVAFFNELNHKFSRFREDTEDVFEENVPTEEKHLKALQLRDKLIKGNVRKGDLLVVLPVHHDPGYLLSLNNKFTVGHVGIITETINSNTNSDDKIGIEAWNWAYVQDMDLLRWRDSKIYVMCFLKKITRIRISLKKGVEIITTHNPVNTSSFLNYASSKLGRPYVKKAEFPIMKFAAKNWDSYTCTTLVWKAADLTLNISPSPWHSAIVTPSHIYTDGETHIRTQID